MQNAFAKITGDVLEADLDEAARAADATREALGAVVASWFG
jgi:hypothetical protein